MGKILPILIVIIGLAAGGGAGIFLRPAPRGSKNVRTVDTDLVTR